MMYRTRIEGAEPAPSDKVDRGHRPPPEPSCRPGADLSTDTRLLPRARFWDHLEVHHSGGTWPSVLADEALGRRGSLRDQRTARLAVRDRLHAESVERPKWARPADGQEGRVSRPMSARLQISRSMFTGAAGSGRRRWARGTRRGAGRRSGRRSRDGVRPRVRRGDRRRLHSGGRGGSRRCDDGRRRLTALLALLVWRR